MSDNIASTVRRIRNGWSTRDRPSGVMVDYDDLERCFDILDVHLANYLRQGLKVTIDPNSTVGRNIIHLTREDQ